MKKAEVVTKKIFLEEWVGKRDQPTTEGAGWGRDQPTTGRAWGRILLLDLLCSDTQEAFHGTTQGLLGHWKEGRVQFIEKAAFPKPV